MAERLSYRPAEVREMIGIGRTKLRELLSTGEIESFSAGRARLISRAAIERWVNQSARAGPAAEAEPEGVGAASEVSPAIPPCELDRRALGARSVTGSAITTSQAPEDLGQGA